ncbi:MAG TPA: transposase [Acidimicrobiales bacterium]|nr:transposase [Acidimicrobiales bacterium]
MPSRKASPVPEAALDPEAGGVSPRNKLNDLTAKEWIQETVSVWRQKGPGAGHPDAQIERLHPVRGQGGGHRHGRVLPKAVRKHLPHARHVADRFHVVRNFSKALVSAQRTARGRPHVPSVFHARYLLMKHCDRLSGEDAVKLGAIFDAHPELGVVWGLVQRFHLIFCAPDEHAANAAVDNLAEAYHEAGSTSGPP